MVKPCWRPRVSDDANGKVDGLLWSKDLGSHLHGEFSMAVIQANYLLEDQSQLESGPLSSCNSDPQGTFVGVYDGHGGTEASRFINQNLFPNFQAIVSEHGEVSENVLKKAFLATEEDFLALVKKQWQNKPEMASAGSCCLVGVICEGLLFTANAGDSRVVLGRSMPGNRVKALQLSADHNVNIESARNEIRSMHPNDPEIVSMKHNVWRVKGIIQVSRSIGDAYLKKTQFNNEPLQTKYRLSEPFYEPILSSEPSVVVHKLEPEDEFLIFGSDGLWEHLGNQEAVDIVHNNPRYGIAKRLVKAALKEAAKKREMRYTDLAKIERGVRRHFHDDITVVVVFLDSDNINGGCPVSVRGGGGGIIIGPSNS